MKKAKVPFILKALEEFQYEHKEAKVLEIGCGTAQYREVFGQNYIGLDIENNFDQSVDLISSGTNMKISDSSVDMVFTIATLYLTGEHKSVLREIYRVLKPSGSVYIFDYNKKTQKKLQVMEGHENYPCWSRRDLRKEVLWAGFSRVSMNRVSLIDRGKVLNYIFDKYHAYSKSWIFIEGKK